MASTMRERLSAALVISALVLAGADAHAQAEPPDASAPAPAAPTPEAPTPAAPPPAATAPPAAPPPAAPAPSAAPAAPPAAPAEPAPEAPSPFRGGAALYYLGARNILRASHFSWSTLASSELLGGSSQCDKKSAGAVIIPCDLRMVFALVPRVAFVDTKDHWAWVGTSIVWSATLASNDELERGSTELADLPIQAGYSYTFAQNERGLAVLAGPRAAISFPTSSTSRGIGIYARTGVELGADASIPLNRGAWLNGVFVSTGVGWQHLFSEATTPVNEDLAGARRTGSGRSFDSAQLSTRFFVRDRISLSAGYWLNLWGDLSLGNFWGVQFPFRDSPTATPCDVRLADGSCVSIPVDDTKSSSPFDTAFELALSYAVARLVWITVGYYNEASSIGSNGTGRSMFSSPYAQGYVTGTLLIDQAYARARTGAPPRPR